MNFEAAMRAAMMDTGQGRSIEELKETRDQLKGQESQRLRSYFTSSSMVPSRDLDNYGKLLFAGDLSLVKENFEARVKGSPSRETIVNEIANQRWGPTAVGVYNLLLLATLLASSRRTAYIEIIEYLISAGIPVDGVDLSGTTALMHSISTKPSFDPDVAQMLWDAGAEINRKDRYGGTCAHEIAKIWAPDPSAVARGQRALTWFLDHGGNLDVLDGDGISARRMITRAPWMVPLANVALDEDVRRRHVGGCAFCGSVFPGSPALEDRMAKVDLKTLARCARCKTALYCKPPRNCQRADWPHHKKECKA